MNIAVIPARGGSKRIPRKNIKEFNGKPMISWPIKMALSSGLFDHVIVSTDDKEIAVISTKHGAETPFIRPPELSDDFCNTEEVIAHAISWMQSEKWEVDLICCIYPTSIFFNEAELKKGYEAIKNGDWTYAFSVTDFEYPIFRSFKEHPDGGVEMFYPENFEKRSQDLPEALHDAGQFYWGNPEAWIKNLNLFGRHSFPVKLPRWRVQDIDTKDDWKRAEFLFNFINSRL
jgi:pseudaminic acid cytidylyltransferase